MSARVTYPVRFCECGKQLTLKSRRDIERKRFCSRACLARVRLEWARSDPAIRRKRIRNGNTPAVNAKKAHPSGADNPRWSRVATSCAHCSKPLEVVRSRLATNNFCDKQCYTAFCASGAHKLGRRALWVQLDCTLCGAPFEVPPCRETTAKFCSTQCHCVHNHGHMKKAGTGIERKLAALLDSMGIAFEPQHPIGNKTIPDFFIYPSVCVYADGDYWHGLADTVARDKRINKYLAAEGYTVLRFSELRINNDLGAIKEELKTYAVIQ